LFGKQIECAILHALTLVLRQQSLFSR
jgi:hypothetical protein